MCGKPAACFNLQPPVEPDFAICEAIFNTRRGGSHNAAQPPYTERIRPHPPHPPLKNPGCLEYATDDGACADCKMLRQSARDAIQTVRQRSASVGDSKTATRWPPDTSLGTSSTAPRSNTTRCRPRLPRTCRYARKRSLKWRDDLTAKLVHSSEKK